MSEWLCRFCGDEAVYLQDHVFSCDAHSSQYNAHSSKYNAHLGEYNRELDRWVRTQSEESTTRNFIANVMPVWNSVPDLLELTLIKGDMDRNTQRWIGTQLSKLSKRDGQRYYRNRGAYPTVEDMWYFVITAAYDNRAPKLLAFCEIDIDETRQKAHVQWFISGQATVNGRRFSVGSMLILSALKLSLSLGAMRVKLVALNDTVLKIYEKYGFVATSDTDMHIPDLARAAVEFNYDAQANRFVDSFQFTGDWKRQFYESIETSTERIAPLSAKSEAIWYYASFVMKYYTDQFSFEDGPIDQSTFKLRWAANGVFDIYMPAVRDSPFSRARDAFVLGHETMSFSTLYEHFTRISMVISHDINSDVKNADEPRIVIALPAKIRDHNFFASLLFVAIVSETKNSHKIRFLDLGRPDTFVSRTKTRRKLAYYYPVDMCISNLDALREDFAAIKRINARMNRAKDSYRIYCTTAFATKKALKLCADRDVITFNPHVVNTVRDLLENYKRIEPSEQQYEDERIVSVPNYVDARKLPMLGLSDSMFRKERDVPLTKQSFENTVHLKGVETSDKNNTVFTSWPVFDFSDLVVEALTTTNSTLPHVEPMLDDSNSVFSFIASIDPEELGVF